MKWTTACPDWEARIVEGRSLIPCPPLFPEEADAALKVFRDLIVADVQGTPTMGSICRPWMIDFVAAIFGAYDPEAGRRLISEFFLLISKKNSKSTGAAGIMMTSIVRNWRESAEFLVLAPTIEIANNSFFPARDMVRKDPELAALMHIQEHYRTITNRDTGTTLKVVAADSDTVSGKKATGVLVEELWLFGKKPKAEDMLREATGGLMSRPEGFTIYISTQSDEPPAGVFAQKLKYARDVRDGKIIDPKFLPVLYEFPEQMIEAGKHRDRAYFYVTNPNLGASVDVPTLEREFTKAEDGGEASMRGFLAKHLNVQISQSLMGDSWSGAEFWAACAVDGVLTLDQLIERSEVATAGVDGGGLDDLLGLAVIGRERGTGRWLLWARAWAHRIVLKRRKSIATQLLDLEAAGELTIVDRPGVDVDQLADDLQRVHRSGLFDRGDGQQQAAIGVDPVGIGSVVKALMARGIPFEKIIGIQQGWKMTGAVKTFERELAAGNVRHGGTKLMSWAVGNAKVEPKGNAIVITKQASGTAKIDPLLAALDAAYLMGFAPARPDPPAYQMLFVGNPA